MWNEKGVCLWDNISNLPDEGMLSEYTMNGRDYVYSVEDRVYLDAEWDILTIKWKQVDKLFKYWNKSLAHITVRWVDLPVIIDWEWTNRYPWSALRLVDWVKDWILNGLNYMNDSRDIWALNFVLSNLESLETWAFSEDLISRLREIKKYWEIVYLERLEDWWAKIYDTTFSQQELFSISIYHWVNN